MSEADLSEGWDEDVPKSLGQLLAPSVVETVHRQEAEGEKTDEESNWKVLHVAVIEFWRELNHGNLPRQTEEPHKGKYDGDSVELVVNEFVVLVNLKNEGVIYVVSTEDLYAESCRKEYEADYGSKVVGVTACIYLFPVIFSICWWTNAEENEETCKDHEGSPEEWNKVGVFATNLVILRIKLQLGLSLISLAKAVCVKG